MADPVNPFAQAQGIAGILKQQGVFAPTELTREDIIKQREMVSGLPGLGPVDYSADTQEANDFAKLQFALSLMGRGFASMGAAPGPGENALGAVGRTLVAPLAGDISTIAGPLMKQRAATRLAEQQEERQLKLAALQKVEAENTQRAELAYKLLPADTTGDKSPFESVKYIVRRIPGVGGKPDAFGFTGSGGAAVQVRQERGREGQLGSPLNLVDGKAVTLQPGDEVVSFANLPDNLKGTAGSDGNKETDAQRQSTARQGLLLNSMAEIQVVKFPGDTSAYNAKAAFYFDAKAHLDGKFAFKYIPPGTDINDRSKDVTITNPSIIKLINNKLQNVSDTILKADFGDTAADTQRTRLQDAVRRMLSLPASTVFGAATIENIGTNAANQVIGYAPSEGAISPATVTENAKTAMATLGNASGRYTPLLEALAPLPDVDNEADSRTTWGRLKTAASAFPDVFAYTGEGAPGTDDYDEQTVQQRLDVESGLRNAALNPRASTTDHRAILQKVAIASREKREKIQNKLSDDGNELIQKRRDGNPRGRFRYRHVRWRGRETGLCALYCREGRKALGSPESGLRPHVGGSL